MEPKVSQQFSYVILLLSLWLSSLLSCAEREVDSKGAKRSPFDGLMQLRGSHKGENVRGLHDLKKYLEMFGYLNYHQNQSHADDDDFDEVLESAVKTYQLNFNLKSAGILCPQTLRKLMSTRCGVPDIINGTSSMRVGKQRHHHHINNSFHTVSHFSFLPGTPRWSALKFHLTYGFLPGTRREAISPIARAFDKWASATHFRFSRIRNIRRADLTIGFYRGDHGDGHPFDGPGGTLAHASWPNDGKFHYDADERWSVGAVPDAFDIESVALHEIGHLLGLGHSSVEKAIMYPSIASGVTAGLHEDDIQGIKALYGF